MMSCGAGVLGEERMVLEQFVGVYKKILGPSFAGLPGEVVGEDGFGMLN